MKKTILSILIICSLGASAQAKKDTTVQMTLKEAQSLMAVIDQNIDSKKLTKEIWEFIQSKIVVVDKKEPAKK